MMLSNDLVAGLQTGFIDCNWTSLEQYHPKLLLNDHKRGMKVLTSIIQELRQCEEFYFSVAFITNSGVASLISVLEELELGGKIQGKIVTSQYQNFTEPTALKRLLQFKNIELKIITDENYHGKGYIFKKKDRYSFVIGSSNLTQAALSTNNEWNIKLSSLENGLVMQNILKEFQHSFDNATVVDDRWIIEYQKLYQSIRQAERDVANHLGVDENQVVPFKVITPNKMQLEALNALEILHRDGKRKALLISATGTGKTYLSAFDAAKVMPKKLLFVVHRENIARAAMKSYQAIFKESKTMGLLTGNSKNMDKDFVFATIQTLTKDSVLAMLSPEHFDYIVIDEVHRSGAPTYQKILNHFEPEFLLGMSATPERTDGYDIFQHFDYNIAYEIRLNRALEENMLSPFHYYGVTDIEIDGKPIDDFAEFNKLVSVERVNRIIEKARFYGCDQGRVKGLVFCSRVEEARTLSEEFNSRGYSTVCLDGSASEDAREAAIKRLEQSESAGALDYIFTVDIFNEGIDIPSVNQVIMLRPTQSAIIFVQQLGRGLRKLWNKEYLTVIDFIGNYANNYMVPIALYGDRSYNKDTIRKLINNGSSVIPGCSTVNFDLITKERIFKSIDATNLLQKKDLKKDYDLLKFELGKVPLMSDFLEHGSREPFAFIKKYDSYFGFLRAIGEEDCPILTTAQERILSFYSKEILNGKRVEEGIILALLIAKGTVTVEEISTLIQNQFNLETSEQTLQSAIRNLNGDFLKDRDKEKYGVISAVSQNGNAIAMTTAYREELLTDAMHYYLDDQIRYSYNRYKQDFSHDQYRDGFMLYHKYGRKDVCRILNWDKNEESTIYGYRIKHNTCPIFVTYKKSDDVAKSTQYEDEFINTHQFSWMTRNRVTLDSREVTTIKEYLETGLRIPLFVKKSDGEGTDFYFMGDLIPHEYMQKKIYNDKGEALPIVNIRFHIKDSVDEALYSYFES
jgi:superfamily II DNA or RNA helicase